MLKCSLSLSKRDLERIISDLMIAWQKTGHRREERLIDMFIEAKYKLQKKQYVHYRTRRKT